MLEPLDFVWKTITNTASLMGKLGSLAAIQARQHGCSELPVTEMK